MFNFILDLHLFMCKYYELVLVVVASFLLVYIYAELYRMHKHIENSIKDIGNGNKKNK